MSDREDAARLEGFCDAEGLIVAMLAAMAAGEDEEGASRAPQGGERSYHETRAACLREAALAASLGQHRTDAYDPDAVVAAHRAVVNRSQASAAGKGNLKRSEEARRESARNAANARWGKKEPK